MDEIVVDNREIVAMIHGVEQLLAHAHQRRGTARSEIEPAKQFEPPRFAGGVKIGRGCVRRRLPPGGNGAIDPRLIVTEGSGQRFEEGDARPGCQLGVTRQNFLRQRHAGSLAAAGQQVLAQFNQTRRTFMGRLAPLALDQGAAAVGDALQHFAEEGGVHRVIPSGKT